MEVQTELPMASTTTNLGLTPAFDLNTYDTTGVGNSVQLTGAAITSLHSPDRRKRGIDGQTMSHSPVEHIPPRRSSRPLTGARERKRSFPSASSITPERGPRMKRARDSATESFMRTTIGSGRRPSVDSQISIATSPNLQEFVIHQSDMPQDLKLPALAAPGTIEADPFYPSSNLPGVGHLSREPTLAPIRQRAHSSASSKTVQSRTSSHTTVSGQTLLSPFQHQITRPTPISTACSEPTPLSAAYDRSPESPFRGPCHSVAPYSQHVQRKPTCPPFPLASHHSHNSASGESTLPSLSASTTNVSTSPGRLTPSTMVATPSDWQPVEDPMQHIAYNSHTIPPGGYRCAHEGCEAPSFATQYLLNSHTNVHSQDRPHFCEVEGCHRSERGTNGEGGKGFKRKNEMVRHGLVHESPGYICPWCPDRARRYPRPDNLQRHVRMHHDDKDKEDPRLREILNQRFTNGSNRGRKKRP